LIPNFVISAGMDSSGYANSLIYPGISIPDVDGVKGIVFFVLFFGKDIDFLINCDYNEKHLS